MLLALLPVSNTMATKEQDFVAQMMEHISSSPDTYNASEYHNVTVSPTMISMMIDMMDNEESAKLLPNSNIPNQEVLRQLLKDVKSLRIFTVSNSADKYKELMLQLLKKHKRTYKEYPAQDKLGDKKHIWTRQSNNNVVEIILLDESSEDNKPLQILNLTGVFSDTFFDTLMQMR